MARPARAIGTAACIALCVILGACVDVRTTVAVRADGSGTVTERLELLGSLSELAARDAQPGAAVVDADEARERARAMGDGVRLLSIRPLSETDRTGAIVEFGFDDVRALRLNPSPLGDPPGASGTDDDSKTTRDVRFRFAPGPPAVLTVLMQRPDLDAKAPEGSVPATPAPETGPGAELAKEIQRMLEGLRIALRVRVEGPVLETDASHLQGREVTLLDLEFDRLLKLDPALAGTLGPGADPGSFAEALRRIPGITVESREEIRIVFAAGLARRDGEARDGRAGRRRGT